MYTDLRESLKHIRVLGESERQMLMIHLEQGNSAAALRSIDNIFMEMSHSYNFTYDYFRNICMDIIIILKGFIAQRHLKEEIIWGDSSEMFDLLNESDSMEEAFRYLKHTFELVIHNTNKKKQISGEDIVREAMQFMQSHYHQKISLQTISEKYFIHAGYFSRIFKDIVGRNFNECLTNIRIAKACELLRRTDSTITSISEMVGFEEPKYFSKVFKKGMGITPSEYLETIHELKGSS